MERKASLLYLNNQWLQKAQLWLSYTLCSYKHLQFFFSYFFLVLLRGGCFLGRVCAGEECAGIDLCTWGWKERCWPHLSHLLPLQLVLGPGGPRPGVLRAGEPSASSSVPALNQLYILLGVSLEASNIFCPYLWPRFTKWSVYACHTEINQGFFFHGKSIIFPFICLQMLINKSLLVQESTK